MHRFYADPVRSRENTLFLMSEDAHHALNVLRLREGCEVEVIDRGISFTGIIDRIDSKDVSVKITGHLPSSETGISFTLFHGLPKGDKMDMIVQKAVELGVSRIVPVEMSRCVLRLNEKDASRKQARWQKIAREAVKQCGRSVVPEIEIPVSLQDISSIRNGIQEIVVPWEMASGYGPKSFVRDHPDIVSLGIVIGPEGGISPDEMKHLIALPACALTLGPRILRTETAGLAAISAFAALYGEMEK